MNATSAAEKAAIVLEALANGALVALGGRIIAMGETANGQAVLACQVTVTKGDSSNPVKDFLALPDLPVSALFQWADELSEADLAALKTVIA